MWLYQNRNAWRVAIVILLLASFAGPWFYDKIFVPAIYPCNPPVTRLEGDFCGVPMPGAWIYMGLVGATIQLAKVIAGQETAVSELSFNDLYLFLFAVLSILLLLPAISTAVLMRRRNREEKNTFQIISWGLACCLSVLLIIAIVGYHWTWALWGSWLYVGAAICGFVLEVYVLVVTTRQNRKQKVQSMQVDTQLKAP